jgi:hypothetical protein
MLRAENTTFLLYITFTHEKKHGRVSARVFCFFHLSFRSHCIRLLAVQDQVRDDSGKYFGFFYLLLSSLL